MTVTCGTCAEFIPSEYEPTQGSGMCGKLKEKLDECKDDGVEYRFQSDWHVPEPDFSKFHAMHGMTMAADAEEATRRLVEFLSKDTDNVDLSADTNFPEIPGNSIEAIKE